MALRGLAGDMARNSAGIWKAVAEAVDPKPRRPAPEVTEPAGDEATIDVDAGQMIVPLDAWTRILEQVGHVHEAGQQLADARERAARAEAENEFLRAQLRDLKAQKRSPRRPAAPVVVDATVPDPPASEYPPTGNARLRRVRVVASRWLEPR